MIARVFKVTHGAIHARNLARNLQKLYLVPDDPIDLNDVALNSIFQDLQSLQEKPKWRLCMCALICGNRWACRDYSAVSAKFKTWSMASKANIPIAKPTQGKKSEKDIASMQARCSTRPTVRINLQVYKETNKLLLQMNFKLIQNRKETDTHLWHWHTAGQQLQQVSGLDNDVRIKSLACCADSHRTLHLCHAVYTLRKDPLQQTRLKNEQPRVSLLPRTKFNSQASPTSFKALVTSGQTSRRYFSAHKTGHTLRSCKIRF